MRLISTFCLMLALVLAGTAHAHIGEKVFLIFEIPDADLGGSRPLRWGHLRLGGRGRRCFAHA